MALNINGTTGISGVDGSASAPAVQGTDSNTGVSFGADTVNINTGGTTRATVDSSGDLNIPNDSGKIKLGANGDLTVFHDGTDSFIHGTTGTRQLKIRGQEVRMVNEANSEIMAKFTENSSCELYHDNSKKFETTSSGTSVTGQLECGSVTLSGGGLALADNDQVAFGSGDDAIAKHSGSDFLISNGTGMFEIKCTSGTGAGEGQIAFSSGTGSEAMRILSSGALAIGTNVQRDDELLNVTETGTNNELCCFRVQNTNHSKDAVQVIHQGASGGTSRDMIRFRTSSSENSVGSITANGSSTSYGTSSDYRLKENVTAISDGITRLKTLKPSRFNFKVDKDTTVDGFLAHEVTAVPEAITGTKDEVDSDNNPVYQGIDQSKLVPLLTAALQEAIAKIEVLETKVAALEAG